MLFLFLFLFTFSFDQLVYGNMVHCVRIPQTYKKKNGYSPYHNTYGMRTLVNYCFLRENEIIVRPKIERYHWRHQSIDVALIYFISVVFLSDSFASHTWIEENSISLLSFLSVPLFFFFTFFFASVSSSSSSFLLLNANGIYVCRYM